MRPLLASLAALAAFAASAAAQETHKFPDHGFKISAPSGWTLVPARPGEQWILARFMSNREYQCKVDDKASTLTSTHRPWLRVIGFPKRQSRADVTVVEETETRKTTLITYPYRDYDDYLKRNDHGGGYFVASSEKIIIAGIPVTRQDVKIEKMATVPRRLLACIYHLPDRDLAVEAEVTEQQVEALDDEIIRSLKSLVITGEAKKPESAPARTDVIVGDSQKDVIRKRDERRRAWRERALADVQKDMPKGWTAKKTKCFLVLNHGSDKYAELLVWQANEVREWLDDNLKGVGEGEVMRSILRICASDDEARVYSSGSGDSFVADTGEVVCAERGGSILEDFSTISSALLHQYLADRNPALEEALPKWIQIGLSAYVRSARISRKQGGLIFPPPFGAFRTGIVAIREGRWVPVSELVRTVDGSSGDGSDLAAESELFIRWLLFGSGRNNARTKGLAQRYMQGVVQQLDAMDADDWKKLADSRPTKEPMTEAEEEAEFKRRRSEGKNFAKKHRMERIRLLDELNGTVVKDWKPADWAAVDKAFREWLTMGGGR